MPQSGMTIDSTAPVLRFSVAPEPSHLLRARERLRDYLRLHCADQDLVSDVVLCLEEACTNAIRHSGTSDEMQVELRFEGDQLLCQVSDHGKGFDVAAFDPEAAPDVLATGGRGLYIIGQLMDEMSLRLDGGLEVHMLKRGVPSRESRQLESGLGDLPAAGDLDYPDTRRRALLEEIEQGFIALDWEYRYVHANKAAVFLTGRGLEELRRPKAVGRVPGARDVLAGGAPSPGHGARQALRERAALDLRRRLARVPHLSDHQRRQSVLQRHHRAQAARGTVA